MGWVWSCMPFHPSSQAEVGKSAYGLYSEFQGSQSSIDKTLPQKHNKTKKLLKKTKTKKQNQI